MPTHGKRSLSCALWHLTFAWALVISRGENRPPLLSDVQISGSTSAEPQCQTSLDGQRPTQREAAGFCSSTRLEIGVTPFQTKLDEKTLHYFGDVKNVIYGLVPDGMLRTRVLAKELKVAFQGGSPYDLDSLGEMITVNGVVYARPTDKARTNYYKLATGDRFATTGALIFPHGVDPSVRVTEDFRQGCREWDDICRLLYDQGQGRPVAYHGFVHFEELHGVAASSPPIHGKHVFQHHEEYFQEPSVALSDVHGFVVGACAKFSDLEGEEHAQLREQIGRSLYDGSSGLVGKRTRQDLDMHTHVLLLRRPLKRLQDITRDEVLGVYHLSGTSKLSEISIDLYRIGALRPHPDSGLVHLGSSTA